MKAFLTRILNSANPESAYYGKHMSSDEVLAFFAPQTTSVDAVLDWIISSGIPRDSVTQSANKQVYPSAASYLNSKVDVFL